ncbi:uncharacterized protein PFLUO_LOCUS1454 [Penicillium psychrofluorescens]|uniref:uncharacterized protein n=1 Tax=Penicillium psychrofluorescens TaxID=3158075 RepID=UPI003CCDC1CD
MQNPSCLLYGPGDARFEDRPVPEIEDPHDVIIRIAYVGVCGSDVHFWTDGGIKYHVSQDRPLVMGHEASGTVHAIGPAVTNLEPGDNIAIEPGYACRLCSICKAGRYNLCPKMKFAASPPYTHGTLSKYYKIPADCCFKIPKGMDRPLGLDEAVLMEPLAVAMHSVRQVGILPGDKVLVFGSGTVGLLCAAVAREFGAGSVVIVDLSRDKLDFAKKFIPNERMAFSTYIPAKDLSVEQNANELRALQSSIVLSDADVPGFDVAIEATGAESCIQMAIHALRVGGSYVQTGMGKRVVNFPISLIGEHEITIKGCFRYGAGDFQMGLDMVSTKRIDLKPLITKVVPFENVIDAWETTKRGEGIKTLIRGAGFDEEHK